MVKYGKQYRQYQIEEWKTHYINYKALKQKIKQIKSKLLKEEVPSNILFGVSNINPMPLVPDNSGSTEDQNLAPLYKSKYGKYLKEFIDLLNEQFHKFYIFFSNTEKQLYQEINTHLYARENYHKFTKKQIKNEMNSLGVSIYLAKCLNCFINDNLTAVKKILKKFDKNFVDYFGLIAPRYILSQISSTTNDLDYIIQFKIIDEASCVCEDNANILKEYYIRIENNPIVNNNNDIENQNNNIPEIQVDFMQQYKELLMCVREIDEIIDFKIQYKEWFSFIKKGNKLVKNNPTLLENDIFNPLLSSTNYKDSLIEKFLSTNRAFYEIEDVQISVSDLNERNMKLILLHKFFYNTLLTCLIPIIYFFIDDESKNKNSRPTLSYLYAIIILSISHISSYFTLYFFKHPGTKTMLSISYCLFLTGSLFHIISCNEYFNKANNLPRFLYLIISRIFIGIGSMEVIGRKYIALYSPRFYLIKISKNYSLYNFLGYAFGPLITLILLIINKYFGNQDYKGKITYNEFNCIGWYGVGISFILFLVHLALFTRQNADDFQMIRNESNLNFAIKTSFHSERAKKKLGKRKSKISITEDDVIITKKDLLEGLIPDEEDEKKDEKTKQIIKEDENKEHKEEEKKEEKKKQIIKEDEKKENDNYEKDKEDEILNINKIEGEKERSETSKKKKKVINNNNEKFSQSANDLIRVDIGRPSDLSICSNNLDTGLNSSQILSTKQKKMINSIESKLDEYNEKSNFTNINMIPKAIDHLIRKEKKKFGYLKSNILVIFLLLFFSNILKSYIIVWSSYCLYNKEMFIKEIICTILIGIYLLQTLSLVFVLPLKKINVLMKKYLIIFMFATILFIAPLLYEPILESGILVLIISSGLTLLSTIISILSCCYLSYLLPPGWKIYHIHAGKLPSCLIVLGKLLGILFNLLKYFEYYDLYTIFGLIFICYISIIIYLFKTNNFRIKVISRIMRKKVFENMGI